MAVPLVLAAGVAASVIGELVGSASKAAGTPDKARATAQDFEAVFLNSMFQRMFTDVDGDSPLGGGSGTAMWRSFLTDEYAKSFAKAGGIGLADYVYRALIAQQEAGR